MKVCTMCGEKAIVVDIEYDEYWCDEHAKEYCVYDGEYRMLEDEEE